MFAHLMEATDNISQQIVHFKKAKKIAEEIGDSIFIGIVDLNLELTYIDFNKLDSALSFEKNAEHILIQTGQKRFLTSAFSGKGDIYFKKGDKKSAKQFYYEGIQSGREQNNLAGLFKNYFALTKCYLSEKNKDSSLYYAKKALEGLNTLGIFSSTVYNIGTAYENLYHSYQLRNQFDSAFKYQGLALVAKDSLYKKRIKNLAEFQNASLKEQLRLQNVEKEKVVYQNKVRTSFLLAGIAVLVLLAFIFYRNNRQKLKAKIKIEKAYEDLKATQRQLIQSEKMASLGELTAGIAHEIQNPLNFVNNFSEVSTELVDEMNEALAKGNTEAAQQIADDLKQNLEKINHHGKRAGDIVKGMLQHSRSSSGTKEPTDINALADEYLRLAYHGLRAKDISFNATMKTGFDESIGKINIVPQDIGRVILNLITNAFYAVTEKKKQMGDGYEPTVSVITKRIVPLPGGPQGVEVRVTDNGNGIPQKVIDKIFQPFFTTKPTGQGTGLGLSLSYDIVKAHGGDLKVETKEGEGSEFMISLPANI
ncbi:MAG: ATP-binding protein [Sediminibacterium sp.]|nr:ATP-binding protein [Sediminibacterium sp.]MDP3666001.1 ATP-binding protein [Sediminibacterium sp.]